MHEGARLKAAIDGFHRSGAFSEDDYQALRGAVEGVGRVDRVLLDGFVGLFFERHLLDDVRRAELAALPEDELLRAVRHRFKQVVAGERDSHQAWHALSAHVRDALRVLVGPARNGFPLAIAGPNGFLSVAVEEAVGALWAELGRRPSVSEATGELFTRYLRGAVSEARTTSTRDLPAVLVTHLDAQRLARGMLELLTADEKSVLRAQLDGEPVEKWAQANGVSRATAYRLLARVKALCRVSFDDRTSRTQLAVLDVLRGQL
ncbi:MAG: hypothetical protein AB1938_28890 [Myxococcota bacterium]